VIAFALIFYRKQGQLFFYKSRKNCKKREFWAYFVENFAKKCYHIGKMIRSWV